MGAVEGFGVAGGEGFEGFLRVVCGVSWWLRMGFGVVGWFTCAIVGGDGVGCLLVRLIGGSLCVRRVESWLISGQCGLGDIF